MASSLWFPALFFVGFLVCYLIPFHAPTPHDVPVAAYVVEGSGATLYTAGADGKRLEQVVTSTSTPPAASGGSGLEVVDLVPTGAVDLPPRAGTPSARGCSPWRWCGTSSPASR